MYSKLLVLGTSYPTCNRSILFSWVNFLFSFRYPHFLFSPQLLLIYLGLSTVFSNPPPPFLSSLSLRESAIQLGDQEASTRPQFPQYECMSQVLGHTTVVIPTHIASRVGPGIAAGCFFQWQITSKKRKKDFLAWPSKDP